MDEIKNGNFPEPRSRQEMYLQDIIGELSKDSSVSEKAYSEPRSRQESYLQIIIGKIKEIANSEDSKCKCDGKIHIIDETTGKKYSGEIKIINNKPVLEYEEIK